MNKVLNVLGIVAAATVLMVSAVTSQRTSDTVASLNQRLAALETRAAAVHVQAEQRDAAAQAHAHDHEVGDRRSSEARAARQVDIAAAVAPDLPSQEPADLDESVVDDLVTGYLERGYVYGHEWESMSTELVSMTSEQNRRFWVKMNQSLADGSIEVLED